MEHLVFHAEEKDGNVRYRSTKRNDVGSLRTTEMRNTVLVGSFTQTAIPIECLELTPLISERLHYHLELCNCEEMAPEYGPPYILERNYSEGYVKAMWRDDFCVNCKAVFHSLEDIKDPLYGNPSLLFVIIYYDPDSKKTELVITRQYFRYLAFDIMRRKNLARDQLKVVMATRWFYVKKPILELEFLFDGNIEKDLFDYGGDDMFDDLTKKKFEESTFSYVRYVGKRPMGQTETLELSFQELLDEIKKCDLGTMFYHREFFLHYGGQKIPARKTFAYVPVSAYLNAKELEAGYRFTKRPRRAVLSVVP